MRQFVNDDGENVFALLLTDKERALASSLVNDHIRRIESVIEQNPPILPDKFKWMYNLEDKLQK